MTTNTSINDVIREHYAEQIKNNASCCGPSDCCSTDSNLYPVDLLATLPEGESAVSYGCGDPITLASLQPGQTVLDLGSGAGLDCFFAAKKVGETGHVIGADMTPEMAVDRSQSGAGDGQTPDCIFPPILETPLTAPGWNNTNPPAGNVHQRSSHRKNHSENRLDTVQCRLTWNRHPHWKHMKRIRRHQAKRPFPD